MSETEKPLKAVKIRWVADFVFYNIYIDDVTGKYYAVSDKSPLFCLVADTEEKARELANEALLAYATMVIAKE